jgi:hypothetical protein
MCLAINPALTTLACVPVKYRINSDALVNMSGSVLDNFLKL